MSALFIIDATGCMFDPQFGSFLFAFFEIFSHYFIYSPHFQQLQKQILLVYLHSTSELHNQRSRNKLGKLLSGNCLIVLQHLLLLLSCFLILDSQSHTTEQLVSHNSRESTFHPSWLHHVTHPGHAHIFYIFLVIHSHSFLFFTECIQQELPCPFLFLLVILASS